MRTVIFLVLLTMLGCSSQITLTENLKENVDIIKSHIPMGTPTEIAKTIMNKNGFICNLQKESLYCDQQKGGIVAKRWQVIFTIKDNKVNDVVVSYGLVGP